MCVHYAAVTYVRRSFSINVTAGDEYDMDVSVGRVNLVYKDHNCI